MPRIPEGSIVRRTWWALLMPRRLIPLLVMSVPLMVAQAKYSVDPRALWLGLLLCFAFVLVAPVSYRVLFPDGLELSHGAVRLVLYVLVGAGVVLSIGAGLPKLLNLGRTFLTDRPSLAVSIALFLVGGWGLGRDIGFEQRLKRLEREAAQAQLLALKAHLDPHFLFNTLNAIAEWCRTDGEVAETALLKLSQMLRTVLDGVKAPTWPLEKELELTRMLLDLHLLRDPELFRLTVSLPSPLPEVQVPPLSLLTLAENAVKHGPASGHRGAVQLSVTANAHGLDVVLENPGAYRGPRPGSSGLPTVQRQLALAYGTRASLALTTIDDSRTRATLHFPHGGLP